MDLCIDGIMVRSKVQQKAYPIAGGYYICRYLNSLDVKASCTVVQQEDRGNLKKILQTGVINGVSLRCPKSRMFLARL